MSWFAIATEDEPSEAVAERLVTQRGGSVSFRIRKNGSGYLRANIRRFSEMSRNYPVLLLTDLDNVRCPQQLISRWLGGSGLPENFLFRVVVREIEAWLLADHEGFGDFLGVQTRYFPDEPELLADPKAKVIELASKARSRLRGELVPVCGSVASQGIGYSARLADFAKNGWDIDRAASRAPSLARAIARINEMSFVSNCCD